MSWTVVNLGEYRGKRMTLPQIVFDDPDWFFWMCEEKKFRSPLVAEAECVRIRAHRIKVPPRDGMPRGVRCVIDSDGKFVALEVVHEGCHFNTNFPDVCRAHINH